jgi:hypothetical protein
VNSVFPAGGKAGTSLSVTLSGNVGKTPPGVWTSHPGITAKPGPKAGQFELTLAENTPLGPHLLRFYNDEGSAPPRVFMVGTFSEVAETEPNDDAAQGQPVTALPVTVNGKFNSSGDADTYAVELEAGKWLICALHGYGLGSQIDPAMRLLNPQGVEVAMSHDTHNLDPMIAWEIQEAGIYKIQVMAFAHPPAADVNLKGGADAVYRLSLTQGPSARYAFPSGGPRGHSFQVKPLGWNYGASMAGPALDVGPSEPAPGFQMLTVPNAGPEPVLLALHDPLPHATPPAEGELPAVIHGTVGKPQEEDRFPFVTRKGTTHHFHVLSSALHSPLDAWLRLESLEGKLLAQADDDDKGGVFDPSLTWKAPADGPYVLVLSDRFQRGGWDYVFQLRTVKPSPGLNALLSSHDLRLAAGKSAEFKLTVTLEGTFTEKLTVVADGLPPGVKVAPVEVPNPKGGEITLKFEAAQDALATKVPIQILVKSSAPDAPASFPASFDLRGVEPRGDRLVNQDSRLWLTVEGKAPAPPPPPVVSP